MSEQKIFSPCHNVPVKKIFDVRHGGEAFYICPECGRRVEEPENEDDYLQ
jgi:hypothetical protein